LQQTADKAIYAYDQDGVQYRNRYYYNWGNTYYFGADGKRYTDQFLTHGNGDISYFGQEGVQYKNKFYSNWGHQYYFSNNGNLLKNSAVTMNGVSYKADGDGILTKIDFSAFHPDMRYTIPMEMGSETVANNKYIVLHEVGAESGAQTNAAYLSNLTKRSYNNPNVSAAYSTFVVGDGGKTYQLYTPGMVSWAAGGANKDSVVQIELGRTNNASQFWQDYKTYVNLARSAALQFGIPLTLDDGGNGTPGIKTHNWVTHNVWQGDGHVDPYGYLARFGVTKERLAHDLKYGI
ncbi:MAG: N-acetylmuramoyl-L-alanine amidase, partial [Limosilactobacillus sp.]|nr:N-acetylmuramoyl-L-alanine amidase [Limosilactobacillus sp.]